VRPFADFIEPLPLYVFTREGDRLVEVDDTLTLGYHAPAETPKGKNGSPPM